MESGFRGLGRQEDSLMRLVAAAVFPDRCAGCDEEGTVLCDECKMKVSGRLAAVFVCPGCGIRIGAFGRCGRDRCAKGVLDGLIHVGAYAERSLGTLLRRWKYEGASAEGETLLALCLNTWASSAVWQAVAAGSTVVPVPLHPFRLALRGFNQAAVLGRSFARFAGIALATSLLQRRFSWRRQAVLSPEDRQKLGSVSFQVRADQPVPESCLLADDVFTTGTTLEACASSLKAAGAVRVIGLAILRGGPKVG